MMVLCDGMMIGLFCVTQPLKRSRGGADDTLLRALCWSGLAWVDQEDDTRGSQAYIGTTPHIHHGISAYLLQWSL
jgi:hypothetical protein